MSCSYPDNFFLICRFFDNLKWALVEQEVKSNKEVERKDVQARKDNSHGIEKQRKTNCQSHVQSNMSCDIIDAGVLSIFEDEVT